MDCERAERDNIAERYLAGTLTPQAKEEWEQHYFGCDRCAERLAVWQAIDQPLRERAASIRQEIRPRKTPGRWLWVGAGLAAALLVGAGVMVTDKRPAPSNAAVSPQWTELARIDPPAYQPQTLRAAGSPLEVQFQKAMEPYLHHDYPATIAGLQAVLQSDPGAAAPRFFLGACELLTGSIADGIRDLEQVASGDSPFAQEAQFDLAKAYLQQGNQQKAVEILRPLADGQGDFQGQARELIARLTAR